MREFARNLRDLLPIVAAIVIFQAAVIREPMIDWELRLSGAVAALIGMTFFVRGLAMSVFPLGEGIADWLARRGSLTLLLAFSFAIGFGSTVAEPALSAVADQAAVVAARVGTDPADAATVARFSLVLRYTVAAAVGLAVAVGVLRVVKGWPVAWFVPPGYALAACLALVSDSPLATIAFDAGAAATSAINIPLMLALGVGLARIIRGRSPLADGFGVVALASLAPMVVILIIAQFTG